MGIFFVQTRSAEWNGNKIDGVDVHENMSALTIKGTVERSLCLL